MLFVLGSILAGVLLHGYFVDDKVAAPQSMKEDAKAGSSPRLWLVGRSVGDLSYKKWKGRNKPSSV